MKLLLDTHIWLWALLEPERLSVNVSSALLAPESELWLSPISIWEALLLYERGRLTFSMPKDEWIERMVRSIPCREASLTYEIAIASRRLNLPHQDPADRFLAATAQIMGLTLVTADERLIHSAEYTVLSNA